MIPRPVRAGTTGLLVLLAATPLAVRAQQPAGGYLTPPAPIAQILDAPQTPLVSVGREGRVIALLERDGLPAIAELAEPELRLAGMRISQRTGGPSRAQSSSGITFQQVDGGAARPVQLPAGTRVAFPRWSPDGAHMAFLAPADGGMELWVAEATTGQARRLTGPVVNAAFGGNAFSWSSDSRSVLFTRIPAGRGAAPTAPAVPVGPLVQETSGRAAPAATFQDLLSTPHDARLWEHHVTSQLARVAVSGGEPTTLGEPGIITSFSPSPDGRWLLVTRVKQPFSYNLPWSRFPAEVAVHAADGREVRRIADLPLADNIPLASNSVRTGPRSVQWRADAPATLVWAEAQDRGDPRVETPFHDRLLMLAAPFAGEPQRLADLEQRFYGIAWGRNDLALVTTGWNRQRVQRVLALDPSRPGAAPRQVLQRNPDDAYGNPGSPLFVSNAAGRAVLALTPDGRGVFVEGEGASPRGSYPFFGRMSLANGETERLWQAADPHYETVVGLVGSDGSRILTRRESQAEAPNYVVRSVPGGEARVITRFTDPAPQMAGIQRQLITYDRPDGVKLSGTLYLPAGYDAGRDGPLPMLMWAYPREFRDAASASQVTGSPNRFSRPGGSSHLFLLTQGYAILDGPAMPVLGADGKEPNDSFVEQLVANARAAVDKVVEMGVAQRDRIAVGGHSYGAFMTANLLAHSDLFRAGIARSGAYNRSLTPFGFQNEDRTYWQATDTYMRMSPFTYANRVNEPILLIHGEADNNQGTFPVQTERYYAALQGHGATARYVVLPFEAHGYQGRESVKHTLAEMVTWMDRYVKNAPPRAATAAR